MTLAAEVGRRVEARAGGRCEYCRMHQALQGATFHLEHIVPRSRGGSSEPANLAWSCPGCICGSRIAPRLSIRKPAAKSRSSIPRVDAWSDHFRFDGYVIVGQTSIGRATVLALDLNHGRRITIRQAEELFGLFLP
jgi:hypothetical protein